VSEPARPVRAAVRWPSATALGDEFLAGEAPLRGDRTYLLGLMPPATAGSDLQCAPLPTAFRRGPHDVGPYGPGLTRTRHRTYKFGVLSVLVSWCLGVGRARPGRKRLRYDRWMMNASVSLDDCGPLRQGEGGEPVRPSASNGPERSEGAQGKLREPGEGSQPSSFSIHRLRQGVSLNTTPLPGAPPTSVVPYRLPAASRIKPATGLAPSVGYPAKLCSTTKLGAAGGTCPSSSLLNTTTDMTTIGATKPINGCQRIRPVAGSHGQCLSDRGFLEQRSGGARLWACRTFIAYVFQTLRLSDRIFFVTVNLHRQVHLLVASEEPTVRKRP